MLSSAKQLEGLKEHASLSRLMLLPANTRKSCTRRCCVPPPRWCDLDLSTQKHNQVICVPRCTSDKIWRKSINRYWRYMYSGNVKIWDAFGHAVTLTFDLLTPKSNQFISVPRCTSDKSLAKVRQQILEISWKHKTTT